MVADGFCALGSFSPGLFMPFQRNSSLFMLFSAFMASMEVSRDSQVDIDIAFKLCFDRFQRSRPSKHISQLEHYDTLIR